MKTLKQEQRTNVFNFLNSLNTEICITDYVNCEDLEIEDFENDFFDNIIELIQDNNGFDCEVVYYASAMDYLRENDPSLKESLELASDVGYELKNITSELLASLLKTENVRNDFNDLETEINEFFSELYVILEEVEEEEEEN